MGQCVSILPASEVPHCCVCGNEGPAAWAKMDATQRSAWVWEGNEPYCKKCIITKKLEKVKYEKERRGYKAVKAVMYPKVTDGLKPELKRIHTGEKWDGTSSFYQGWKPGSTLKRLLSAIKMAQAEDPHQYVGMQRKATGFVPASSPCALPPVTAAAARSLVEASAGSGHSSSGSGVGEKRADAVPVADMTAADVQRQREQDWFAASHRQLAALEEEQDIEVVEEVTLWGDDSQNLTGAANVGSMPETEEEGAEGEGVRRGATGVQQPAQPAQQQQQQPGGKAGQQQQQQQRQDVGFVAMGDSAYSP